VSEDLARASRPRRENALLTLARIPIVRRMWAVITFSSLGDWLGLLANTALAQQLTHQQSVATQGAAISGVILVRLSPDLFFGPIAAAMADKFDRRKIVIIGDTIAGLLYASIAIAFNLVWLYVAQFVIEAVGLFTQPAKQVIQTTIVPKKLLATANQISLFSVYGTVPIASGLFALLSAVDRLFGGKRHTDTDVRTAIVIALLFNTVSFLVSAATVFFSRHLIPVAPAGREQSKGIIRLLREGVVFVRRDPLIRKLYVGIIGAFAAGGLTVGVAQLWVNTLSAGAAGYSIMFGTVFTGLAIGMLIGPKVLPAYTRSRVFGLAVGGAGISLLTMSVIRDFILADILASSVGLFAGMAWIIGYTLIGQEVEDRLRGRIFAFVLSSVRIVLLLSIAVGPVIAGWIGSHSIPVGEDARLRFSGPGLTLLVGGFVALGVSYYATSRSTPSGTRLRDLARRRLLERGVPGPQERTGLFVTVDGVDPAATARWAALVTDALRARRLVVTETCEPTDSAVGRRIDELLRALAVADDAVEPQTAALLSAADRAEHVANVIRPALVRREAIVCDRFLLTSLAVHGGGRGADMDRIRQVNAWSTGDLLPDVTLVVPGMGGGKDALVHGFDAVDLDAVREALLDAANADPDRCITVPGDVPAALPGAVLERLQRLIDARASVLARAPEQSRLPQ